MKGSFIPPKLTRELRDLTRYRRKLVGHMASEKNRLQKILEDANIKLSSVVSDMSGSTARKIINSMLEGEENPKELAKLRHGKMKASESELEKALQGKLSDHHKFMLSTIKASIDHKLAEIEKLDDRISQQLTPSVMST